MSLKCLTNHLWIDKKYKKLFNDASFTKLDDFIDKEVGEIIRLEPEKSIRFLKIDHSEETYNFFLKFSHPKWTTGIKRFLRYGCSYQLDTLHELKMIRLYQQQMVAVVKPVGWGEKRLLGIPVRGVLIQKQVEGSEFTELLRNGSMHERIKLIKAYGKLVADLHSKGLISSIVRVTDLICTSSVDGNWETIRLEIIDREKGPLTLECFSLEKCINALSSILIRFCVYVGEPRLKEICYFLKIYIKYLNVNPQYSVKELFYRINKTVEISRIKELVKPTHSKT